MMLKFFVLTLFFNMYIFADFIRSSSDPFISGDSFRALANHIYDETDTSLKPENVKKGDIIFVKGDLAGNFFRTIHTFITQPYVLITHNADAPAPGDHYEYLQDAQLYRWFGHNPTIEHPKFTAIPIGIANQYWDHGNIKTFKKALTKVKYIHERPFLLGINFIVNSNADVRQSVYNLFIKKSFCSSLYSRNSHLSYLINMHKTKYILSPPGNGLDCHRTWEALIMGSIPIVISSHLDSLFKDLPVLIVHSWEEVTEDLLKNNYDKIVKYFKTPWRQSKIFFPYWKNLIQSHKAKLLKS